MRFAYKSPVAAWLAVAMLLANPVFAQQIQGTAPDYRVVAGDRLMLSVPQRPDLDRELVVGNDGTVSLPLVGKVEVVGLTGAEIEKKLLQAMKDYYPSLTATNVEIQPAGSFEIYVIGQVGKPGKYRFRSPPNLWEVIREAGGATVTASMDNVRVVQDLRKGGASTVVNVQRELENGNVDRLPRLDNGDTVVIPEKEQVYSGEFGVNVFGAVTHPGVYRLQSGKNLMSALLLAGGPIPEASLKNIKVVRPQADGSVQTVQIDLSRFLETGDPTANPLLQPGDTVSVPRQNRFAYLLKNEAGFILNIVTTAVTVAVLVVTIQNNNNRAPGN